MRKLLTPDELLKAKAYRETIHELRVEISEKQAQIEDLYTQLTRIQTKPRFKFPDLVVWNIAENSNHTRVGQVMVSIATAEGWEYDIQTHALYWTEDQPRWTTKRIKERDLHTARGWTEKDLIPKKFRPKKGIGEKKTSGQEKTCKSSAETIKLWDEFLNDLTETKEL